MKKVAIVTGGARGIGKGISELFALEGYSVIINYKNSRDEAESLVSRLGEKGCEALAIKADVSCRGKVEKMVGTVIEKYGHIDVLVNNAGIAQQKLFTDITMDDWDRMLDVNLKGTFNCCQCVLPGMVRRKSGKIINISSVWGITGASCEVHYSAAKAGMIGLTKALAKEVGPSGITVNCVAPGVIDTEMNGILDAQTMHELKESTPMGVIGKVEDVANTVVFLASEKAEFITGQVISPNGGFVI